MQRSIRSVVDGVKRVWARPAGHARIEPLPLVGHAWEMRKDPLALLLELTHAHGGIAPITLGPYTGHLVTEPGLVEEVFVQHPERYHRRTRVYLAMAEFLGQSILTTEGDDWRVHRRIVQPGFQKKRLATFADRIGGIAEEAFDGWLGEVDVAARMMEVTLRIVSEVLLGTKTSGHADAIGASVEAGQRYAESVMAAVFTLPPSIPTPRRIAFNRTLARIDEVAFSLIDEKTRAIAEGEAGDDVATMLLEARYEDGTPLERRRVRDELITLLAAGHETTSNALTWTLIRLSQHPDVRRRLREEVEGVLGGRTPGYDDVKRLTYTRWVFDESMRLHPPVWATGRCARVPHRLGNRDIAEGELLLISPYVTHRRPDLWDNAEGFDPERWRKLAPRGALPPFTFYPFGGGSRKCVGESFAYLEAVMLLAMLVQRYDLQLSGRPIRRLSQITMGTEGGVWMKVEPASPGAGRQAAAQ
ncbi:MAG: cytochrome P450 [Myxococcota bacterium]